MRRTVWSVTFIAMVPGMAAVLISIYVMILMAIERFEQKPKTTGDVFDDAMMQLNMMTEVLSPLVLMIAALGLVGTVGPLAVAYVVDRIFWKA